jgi:hypothetical protein
LERYFIRRFEDFRRNIDMGNKNHRVSCIGCVQARIGFFTLVDENVELFLRPLSSNSVFPLDCRRKVSLLLPRIKFLTLCNSFSEDPSPGTLQFYCFTQNEPVIFVLELGQYVC